MKNKIRAVIAAAAVLLSSAAAVIPQNFQYSASAASACTVEKLDRGISAINTGSGMLVSWRYLANDSEATVFKLYRDNSLIYTSNSGESTCFLDATGSSSSKYRVDSIVNGTVNASDN